MKLKELRYQLLIYKAHQCNTVRQSFHFKMQTAGLCADAVTDGGYGMQFMGGEKR